MPDEGLNEIPISKKDMTPDIPNKQPFDDVVILQRPETGKSMLDRQAAMVANPSGNRFIDRYAKVLDRTANDQERKDAIRDAHNLAEQAIYGGFVDQDFVKDELLDIMSNSDWEYLPGNLRKAASKLEEESRQSNPLYDSTDVYHDVVRQEVLAYASLAKLLAEKNRQNTPQSRKQAIIATDIPALNESRGNDGYLLLGLDVNAIEQTVNQGTRNRVNTAQAEEFRRARILSGEEKFPLPETAAERRAFLIAKMEVVETSETPITEILTYLRPTHTREISDLIYYTSLPECESQLRDEIIARLKLQQCYAIVKAAEGFKGKGGEFLQQAFNAEAKKFVMQGDDMKVLFHLPDVDVARAFDVLQRANFEGLRINGHVVRANARLTDTERERLDQKIIAEIGGDLKAATKALQLAKRFADATMESSVWDSNANGTGVLTPFIYLYEWRHKGENDSGAATHFDLIPGFDISSFLRIAKTNDRKLKTANGEVNGYVYLDDPKYNRDAYARHYDISPTTLITQRQKRSDVNLATMDQVFYTRNRAHDSNTGSPVYIRPKALALETIEDDSYFKFLTSKIPKLYKAKEMLLKTDYTPKDCTDNAIQDWGPVLDAADPTGLLQLRRLFADQIFAIGLDHAGEWTPEIMGKFLANLTEPISLDGRTSIPRFISQEQLREIINEYRVMGKTQVKAQFMQGVKDVLTKKFGIDIR